MALKRPARAAPPPPPPPTKAEKIRARATALRQLGTLSEPENTLQQVAAEIIDALADALEGQVPVPSMPAWEYGETLPDNYLIANLRWRFIGDFDTAYGVTIEEMTGTTTQWTQEA